MMKFTYKILIAALALSFSSCEKFLDRLPLTSENDETAWVSEDNVRLYVNQYYPSLFPGYGNGFSTTGAPLVTHTHTDDTFVLGNQSNFTRAIPPSSTWSYSTIRSINVLIDRVQNRMSGVLTAEAQNHWLGIGRFLRGYRYAELVASFGDVPYYDREILDIEEEELYKPRTPRNEVMDAVYDDLVFALDNVRTNDGNQQINRHVVATLVSRIALHEGTWQKYHYNNTDRARKFLNLAVTAADIVILDGRYDIVTDYRSLFTSDNLNGNRDCIFYRNYDASVGVTHSIASNSNLESSTNLGPTSDLLKSYICTDGRVWQNSTLDDTDQFNLSNLIATRDSRLEATFYSKPEPMGRSAFVYITKFLPRSVEAIVEDPNGTMPPEFTGDKNETDFPVLRYSEVLLNWIEAKAELATMGGAAVTQSDIDVSINKIRSRPLAEEAVNRGVTQTAPLLLNALPDDPERDETPQLLWEIRRERRMEFAFETNRLDDLKRWKKLAYMDTDLNPDLLSGGWIDFPSELPSEIKTGLSVVDLDGNVTVYNGSNASEMKGFYRSTSTNGRFTFLGLPNVNPYLTPVGTNQIDFYETRGYVLQQTEGWGN